MAKEISQWEEETEATPQNLYELREELIGVIKDSEGYGRHMNSPYSAAITCNKRMLRLLNNIIHTYDMHTLEGDK